MRRFDFAVLLLGAVAAIAPMAKARNPDAMAGTPANTINNPNQKTPSPIARDANLGGFISPRHAGHTSGGRRLSGRFMRRLTRPS